MCLKIIVFTLILAVICLCVFPRWPFAPAPPCAEWKERKNLCLHCMTLTAEQHFSANNLGIFKALLSWWFFFLFFSVTATSNHPSFSSSLSLPLSLFVTFFAFSEPVSSLTGQSVMMMKPSRFSVVGFWKRTVGL